MGPPTTPQNSRLWHSPNICKATLGNKRVLPTERKIIRGSAANVNAYMHGDRDPAWCATVQFDRATSMSVEPAHLSPTAEYSPTATDWAAERPTTYYEGPGFESRPHHRLYWVKALKIFLRATKYAGIVSCNRLQSLPSRPFSFHHAQFYQHTFYDNGISPTRCSISCPIMWDVRRGEVPSVLRFSPGSYFAIPLGKGRDGRDETIVGLLKFQPKTSSW
jgi:hypothetical protein